MNDYRTFLAEVLGKASGRGVMVAPDKLRAKLAEQEDPLNYAGSGDGSNESYRVFIEDFPFLDFHHRLLNGERNVFSEDQVEMVEGLVRWLCCLIKDGPFSSENLAAILFIIEVLAKDERLFWQEFPVSSSRSGKFFEAIALLIEKASITPQAHRPAEEAYVDDFNRANVGGDFVTLDKLDHYLSQCFFHNGIIRSAVRLLAYYDLGRLIGACSAINSVLIAREVCDALPSRCRFLIACNCSSLWMKFTCLSTCQSDRRQKAFSKQVSPFAVQLLRQLLDDPVSRDQFVEIYCTYPSRYPALQEALGESLSHVSEAACKAYVGAIKVDWGAHGRDEVSCCLKVFQEKASLEQCRLLFKACFKRWQELIDKRDDDQHHFKPFQSKLDYGVVAYLYEFVSDEDIEAGIAAIRERLSRIKTDWHHSSSDAITSFHILFSKGQPYCHALKIRQSGGNLLSRAGAFADFIDLSNYSYLKIQYHCDWLE